MRWHPEDVARTPATIGLSAGSSRPAPGARSCPIVHPVLRRHSRGSSLRMVGMQRFAPNCRPGRRSSATVAVGANGQAAADVISRGWAGRKHVQGRRAERGGVRSGSAKAQAPAAPPGASSYVRPRRLSVPLPKSVGKPAQKPILAHATVHFWIVSATAHAVGRFTCTTRKPRARDQADRRAPTRFPTVDANRRQTRIVIVRRLATMSDLHSDVEREQQRNGRRRSTH